MPIDLIKMVRLFGRRVALEDMGIMLQPQEFPPRNCFYLDDEQNPVVAAGAVDQVVFSYQVPEFRKGVLRRLAVEPLDPAGIPSIRWSIRRSGSPVQTYQNEQAPIGTLGVPDTVYVEFDRQQLLEVIVSNVAAFPFDLYVRVVAWFWDVVDVSGR